MKILIITGLIAQNIIKENLKNYPEHEIYLKIIPIPIAAFITPQIIVYYLKEENKLNCINKNKTTNLNQIDMILTSGLIQQNTDDIKKQLDIKAYKGPSNAADIKNILDNISNLELSTTKPADFLLKDQQYNESMDLIKKYEEQPIKNEGNYTIGKCKCGYDYPMRILGEIPNAINLNEQELLKKVSYYIDSGADMIDIGMHAGENNPDEAYNMIKLIKDNFDIPVSIDSMNPNEIKSALKAQADLILSIDHGNYDKIIKDIEDYDSKAVILPTNYSKNYIPTKAEDRVKSLEKLDDKCENITTISDVLLDPINSTSLTESICACNLYRKRNPYKALFFGIGNVSELLDADSNGVHAVLSGIAMENKVSILFTPESSLKTKNAIKELKTASHMMFLSNKKNTIPKNLGINLINYKDSSEKIDANINTEKLPHIKAKGDGKFTPDIKGSFKIILEDNLIKAIYYKDYKKTAVITGTKARDIYEEILRRELISRMEHSAYLGMELEKAEIALKLDKTYIQDFPIF